MSKIRIGDLVHFHKSSNHTDSFDEIILYTDKRLLYPIRGISITEIGLVLQVYGGVMYSSVQKYTVVQVLLHDSIGWVYAYELEKVGEEITL